MTKARLFWISNFNLFSFFNRSLTVNKKGG